MTSSSDALRRVDWRFLLPDIQLRSVVAMDREEGLLAEGLAQVGATLIGPETVGPEGASVVLLVDPDERMLQEAISMRLISGAIVIEATSHRSRRRTRRHLRGSELVIREYGAWPRCVTATRFVPLDSRSELIASTTAAKNRRRRALGTVLTRLGLGSFMFTESTTIATAHGHPDVPAPVRVVLGAADGSTGAMTLLTPRFASSRHVIAMVTDTTGRQLVTKTSRRPDDDAQLTREAIGLRSIVGASPKRPELVADVDSFGQRWVVQTRLTGEPLARRHIVRDGSRWSEAGKRWLTDMPVGGWSVPDADGRSDRLIAPAFEVLEHMVECELDLRHLLIDAAAAFEEIRSVPLPRVVEHGDFRPPNLLITASSSLGAVDWELSESNGLPLHDLSFFHAYIGAIVPDLRLSLQRSAIGALRSMGVDPALLRPLSSVALLRHLANVVVRGGPDQSRQRTATSDVTRAWLSMIDSSSRTYRSKVADG